MKDPIDWVEDHEIEQHRRERAENGFSTFDFWNADEYLAFVIGNLAKKFREEGHGYPTTMTSEEWNDVLERIERGMEAHLELTNLDYGDEDLKTWYNHRLKLSDEGIKLFAEYFGSFWD